MIAVVTILYISLIILIYKILKIRPRPTNIAAMVVLGVLMIGAIVIVWRFSSPMANRLVVGRYTVALVSQVKGPITNIYAEPNTPLKAGVDKLYDIQPDLYQYTVDQIGERLKAAELNIDALEAAAIAADAAVKRAEANRAAADAELAVANETAATNADAISKLAIQQLTQQLNSASAAVDQANATAVQAKISQRAAKDTAASIKAELADAQFDLQQCTVYAPADGFVTNWAVREGTMAVPLPLAPLGTFVDTSRVLIVASFPQNLTKNVQPGDAAELTFKTRPGEIFSATVESIVEATGEGQLSLGGTVPKATEIGSNGYLAVKFRLDDESLADQLAMGTAGTVAVYTQTGKMFHVISKVTVRINAWMYYLIPA
ncbi:efflux RND transporter periplasmic adaptor subunit [Stieleria sp. TO1_6]|uniref:HlyD family secretion protein n=1 Tax=Stieleria tagensis TaxID=2956795 RepID=UPI00209AB8C6|nr:efflux RND transporter periplasmic adaptor subunit [Stieleria tagensis]MCO8124190.1 efflux RND transporter periplasmic adaptor subunit [Stieleria tagensis]